eukprot:jgi/Botrbrau1/3338/Bobra.0048s0033.1
MGGCMLMRWPCCKGCKGFLSQAVIAQGRCEGSFVMRGANFTVGFRCGSPAGCLLGRNL